jgi:polyisoprenoid-binding protein YceI
VTTPFRIDPAHTDIAFSAKHMMVTTVRGKFDGVDGELHIDEANPTRSSAEIRVQAASLSTGFEARDQHLRSADFLDVEHHPVIVFRSTGIEQVTQDRFRITGDLTIRETTRPVTLDAELLGFYPGLDGSRRVGLSIRTTINRKDWGLNWNVALESGGWLVGEDIKLEIDVAATEAAASGADAAVDGAPDEHVDATEVEAGEREAANAA